MPCKYDNLSNYSKELARIREDGKSGLINKKGQEIVSCVYDAIYPLYSDGFLRVKKENKYGFLNNKFKETIPCVYDDIGDSFTDGVVKVKKDEKWGFIDKSNKVVVPLTYEEIGDSFSENLVCVKKNGMWGFVDKSNNEVISYLFDSESSFSEGLAAVKKEGKWGYINKKGNSTFEYQEKLEINEYNKYVGRWRLDRTTDEGRKMRMEVKLKADKSGEFAVFHLKGSSDEVLVFEEYPQCILVDGVIYLTKNGEIIKGKTPQLIVGSDGLYSVDNQKYVRVSD